MLGDHRSNKIHVIVVDGASPSSTQIFFVVLGGRGIIRLSGFELEEI